MEQRLGVIGIVIENARESSEKINTVISKYSDIVIGRMGIPGHDKEASVISLLVKGTTDNIGALSGQLGNINGVNVKSAVASRKRGK